MFKIDKVTWFNKREGTEETYYELLEWRRTWYFKHAWRPVGYRAQHGFIRYTGSISWARKIAKRYNIEIPK